MHLLRANTAVDVLIGPFVDDTDGKTAETGLTISQADVKLSKNGQALAQKNDATAASHDSDGYYNCELDATDTNTEGQLDLIVNESGALPVRHSFCILAEAAWDSLFSAKDDGFMDVNVKTIGRADTQETEADNLESACANYSATRGLSGTALPAAAADAAGGLPISDAGGLDLDTKLANTNEVTAARMGALTDWVDGGRLDLILDAIVADTNELQTDDVPGLISALNDPTAAAIADAVWDEAATGHTDAGKAGAQLWTDIDAILADTDELQTDDTPGALTTIEGKIDTIDGIVDSILVDTGEIGAAGAGLTAVPWNASWDAEVQSECTDALNAYDPPTKAELDSGLAGLNDISAADVWDATEAITGDTLSFETLFARVYMFLFHKMTITDASGNIAVRNTGDTGDVMTGNIVDNDTTTTRAKMTMV